MLGILGRGRAASTVMALGPTKLVVSIDTSSDHENGGIFYVHNVFLCKELCIELYFIFSVDVVNCTCPVHHHLRRPPDESWHCNTVARICRGNWEVSVGAAGPATSKYLYLQISVL